MITLITPNRRFSSKNIWGGVHSVTPPLGLASLAAVLEEHKIESSIIDGAAHSLDIDDIIALIPESSLYVGITAMTVEIADAKELAKKIRESKPHLKIIMGGVHPTLFHEELVLEGWADIVIRNQGEYPLLNLLKGAPIETVENATWLDPSGQVRVNPDRESYNDIENMPFPAYHRLDVAAYRSAAGAAKRSPSIGVATSIGCPGKCTFCFSGMHGSKIRSYSAERVVKLIEMLIRDHGIKEVSFYDDTFTWNRSRVVKICELLIEGKVDVTWSCFARVDTVDPELLLLMKKAGCHQLSFGIESADEDVLGTLQKNIGLKKIHSALKWCKEIGIDIRAAFILGSPGETKEQMEKTIRLAKQLKVDYAMFNIMTPYPGSQIYCEADREGRLLHKNWELYDLSSAILKTDSASAEEIEELYKKAYKSFYLRPAYIFKRLSSFRDPSLLKHYVKAGFGILKVSFFG